MEKKKWLHLIFGTSYELSKYQYEYYTSNDENKFGDVCNEHEIEKEKHANDIEKNCIDYCRG